MLTIDVVSIVLSFALALVIRFRILVASLGSNLVVTTYIPFFIAVLIAYVVLMLARSEIRIDRMSKREILEQTEIQQIILSALYTAVFFLLHRADAISRIVVGLFFISCVVFCGIGRICYHEYCQKKSIEVVNNAKVFNDRASENKSNKVRHVYIVGSKSIGQYGGYESFVMNLLQHHKDNKNIKYHVACKANGQGCMNIDSLPGAKRINEDEFTYCNAQCFLINIPEKIGSAKAIYYDLKALRWCCDHIERNHIEEPVVYILASRVGPFEKKYVKRVHNYGGKIWQNPDGWEHARRNGKQAFEDIGNSVRNMRLRMPIW